ncbi:uncharacterized protein LOC141905711 [Tubulanus polymorphus]|uniref:uncharacterized protein LOC141905711 n=1 Tax=Tubulanus polymorphus TaxID=672921 RepID=UPI003DA5FA88
MASHKTASPEGPRMIKHVVTSPDALLEQLEHVKLSDTDTENLLDEAYALNKLLKEELRRQEDEESSNNASNHRPSAASSKRRPQRLPPLHYGGFDGRLPKSAFDLYSKQPPSKTSPQHSKSASGGFHNRRKSAPSPTRSDPAKTSPKRSQVKLTSAKKGKKVPVWDDRFAYS